MQNPGWDFGPAQPAGASNQFFSNLPSLPMNGGGATSSVPSFVPGGGAGTPGVVAPQGSNWGQFPTTSGFAGQNKTGPGSTGIGNGMWAVNPIDPSLTSTLFSWLTGQIGKGVTPFNQSTALPSGGDTAPGQLNAPLNQILQQLMQGFSGQGSNIPGMNTLTNFANNGMSAIPEWQSMMDAQQRNIQQNAANLQEKFGAMGMGQSSPYGTGMSDYYSQTAKDQNALLAQLQQQNTFEQLGIGQGLQQGGQQLGMGIQGLDQQAIQNMLQEFIRTSPESNPLLNMMYGGATTFPPTYQKKSGGGILGGLLGSIGSLAGGASAGLGASAGGSGIMSSILTGLMAL